MGALARIGLYSGILIVVFAASFVTAGAVVPEDAVEEWTGEAPASHSEVPSEGPSEEHSD